MAEPEGGAGGPPAQLEDTEMAEPESGAGGGAPAGGLPELCSTILNWKACRQRLRKKMEGGWRALSEERLAEMQEYVAASKGWPSVLGAHVLNLEAYPAMCVAAGVKTVENRGAEHTGVCLTHVCLTAVKNSQCKFPVACCLEQDPERLDKWFPEHAGMTAAIGFLEPVGQHRQLTKQEQRWTHVNSGMPIKPAKQGVAGNTHVMIFSRQVGLSKQDAERLQVPDEQQGWGRSQLKKAGFTGTTDAYVVSKLLYPESVDRDAAHNGLCLEEEYREETAPQAPSAPVSATGSVTLSMKPPPPRSSFVHRSPIGQLSASAAHRTSTGRGVPVKTQEKKSTPRLRTLERKERPPTLQQVVNSLRLGEHPRPRGS